MTDAPLDPKEILTRERLLKALGTARNDLFTPTDHDTMRRLAEHPDLSLSDAERVAISRAFVDSPRLLSGFAYRTLERYDDLYAGGRAEALDLFADIVHHPYFSERTSSLRPPRCEIER